MKKLKVKSEGLNYSAIDIGEFDNLMVSEQPVKYSGTNGIKNLN
jgi:hypothetical protein